MYTKGTLTTDLERIGIDPKGTLLVHLSYKALGKVEGGADTVVDTLIDYMKEGLLVLPSHTWSSVGYDNPVMDVLYTPSCVGIVPELFRTRPGVIRSLHPTHSVAVLGKGAEELIAGEENITTPCGKGGVHYKLWEKDAQILLIGINFSRNTYVHGIEEWDGAEGSISKEKTELYIVNYDGMRIYTPQYRHCAPLGSETFVKLETPAFVEGVLSFGNLAAAPTRLMKAKPLRAMAAELLRKDPRHLLSF
ncbi:MAG: AAC(3) family N-acetyltransferase [Lachnospiraceae bacterium]|jgi:aminoglycoside 3-N-acetyltransferase|nr:AAC(3) family N-acetyltransferase [Lachnospiraceae bacterium]